MKATAIALGKEVVQEKKKFPPGYKTKGKHVRLAARRAKRRRKLEELAGTRAYDANVKQLFGRSAPKWARFFRK